MANSKTKQRYACEIIAYWSIHCEREDKEESIVIETDSKRSCQIMVKLAESNLHHDPLCVAFTIGIISLVER